MSSQAAYPACFIKEEKAYSVIFPDLGHLATCGNTLDEAFHMAVDCLTGYLYLAQKDGDDIPAPSSVDQIDLGAISEDIEYSKEESFVSLVRVDVSEYARIHF